MPDGAHLSISQRFGREFGRRLRATAGAVLARLPPAYRAVPDGAWLLGGSGGCAYGDNSAAFHRYLRRHHPDQAAYWVINDDSVDVGRAQAEGPVLFRGSAWTYAASRHAEVHVISHGVHDVPLCESAATAQAVKVRLGHGLTAMKKTKPRSFHTNRSANAVFDVVPVASEFERQNKRAWDIDDDALVVTGLARFDDLVELAKTPPQSRILYMPTWRSQSADRQIGVVDSIVDFLREKKLIDSLAALGFSIDVYLHRNMAVSHGVVASRLSGLPIRVLPVEHDVQLSLATCAALITDYSSVCWDALYIDRPVLFYQFDLEQYLGDRGAYFDIRNDSPGPSAFNAPDAARMVANEISDGLRLSTQARRWQGRAFRWRDAKNCERIYDAVKGAVGNKSIV